MTSIEIVNRLKDNWGLSSDAALARKLGISRTGINQYKQRKTTDIQTAMIIELLKEIEAIKNKSPK